MELATPWTATGDFEIEMDFATTTVLAVAWVGGGTGSDYIRLNADKTISVRLNSASVTTVAVATNANDGKLHNIKLVRTSSTSGELFLDGVSFEAFTINSGTATVDLVGQQNSGNYFSGTIANLKLTDLDTPSNSLAFSINEPTANTEESTINIGTINYYNIPEANRLEAVLTDDVWVGTEELVFNGGFDTDSGWTKGAGWSISGGTANSSATSNTLLYQPLTIDAVSYLVKLTVSNFTSGSVRLSMGGTGTVMAADGDYTELHAASADTYIRFEPSFSSGFVGSIDNASVKRALELP